MSKLRYRIRKLLLHNVLHADDTPHAIALGVGIAMVVAFLPLVGIQTFVAIAIAALFRANKAVCVPIVWITNPATMWPIYYGCLLLGRAILPPTNGSGDAVIEAVRKTAESGSVFDPSFWERMWGLLFGLGQELWLGCIIIGGVLGVISYFLSRWSVAAYRERRRQRMLQRSLFRSRHGKSKVSRGREPA